MKTGVSVQILTNLIEAADAPHATQLALAVSGCSSLRSWGLAQCSPLGTG